MMFEPDLLMGADGAGPWASVPCASIARDVGVGRLCGGARSTIVGVLPADSHEPLARLPAARRRASGLRPSVKIASRVVAELVDRRKIVLGQAEGAKHCQQRHRAARTP